MKKSKVKKTIFLVSLIFLSAVIGAQETAISLDSALKDAADRFSARLPAGSRVAILNFQSNYADLSGYIIDELIMFLVNDESHTVVDRQMMEMLRQEIDFQLSGDVSDESAQAIGRQLGAQTIISGAINQVGDTFRLRIQAISVETRAIQGAQNYSILIDSTLAGLIGIEIDQAVERQSNRRLTAGLRAGVSPHLWTLSDDIDGNAESPSTGFEPAVQAAFYFSNHFALQTELALSRDIVSYSGSEQGSLYTASFKSYSLRIPLLARVTFRPGNFAVSGFGGVSFNIPLGTMDTHSTLYDSSSYRFSIPPGYVAGINAGIRLGSGYLFSDIRFSGDFTTTVIRDDSGTLALYQRNTWSFSIGYEFEFLLNRQ